MKKFLTKITPIIMSTLLSASFACSKKVVNTQEEAVDNTSKVDTFIPDDDCDFIETNFIEPQEVEEVSNLERIDCIQTNARVNIRENMSTSSERVSQVDKGYTLELINEYDDWYEVKYLDKTGFIYKKYADRIVGFKLDSIMKDMVYVTDSTPLYSYEDPSLILFEVPKNETCEVYEEFDEEYLVSCKGNYGYISKFNY